MKYVKAELCVLSILFFLLVISFKTTYAQFTVSAKATNNVFSTAASFTTPTPTEDCDGDTDNDDCTSPTPTPTPTPQQDCDKDANGSVPGSDPEECVTPTPGEQCLHIIKSDDGKHLSFTVCNTDKRFKHFQYLLTYKTDRTEEGVEGSDNFDTKNSESKSKDIILGTCSTGGVCVYDKGVHDIQLHITLTNDHETESLSEEE